MNFKMWQKPATMDAVNKLRKYGYYVINPESGKLASLHEGEGRLPKVSTIMNAIRSLFKNELKHKADNIFNFAETSSPLISAEGLDSA